MSILDFYSTLSLFLPARPCLLKVNVVTRESPGSAVYNDDANTRRYELELPVRSVRIFHDFQTKFPRRIRFEIKMAERASCTLDFLVSMSMAVNESDSRNVRVAINMTTYVDTMYLHDFRFAEPLCTDRPTSYYNN